MTLPLGVPVQPDAAQGRSWARAELAGPEYEHPSLLRRALAWLLDRLQDLPLPHGAGTAITGTLVLAALAVVLLWALRRAGGPLARRPAAEDGGVFGDGVRTAAWHREIADRAAASGDLRTAVIERFRAVVRELEERGVLTDQPGRTAGEAAAAAAGQLPYLAELLAAAAHAFDDVRYGGRPPTAGMDAALRELDSGVRAARVTPAGAGASR